MVVTEFQDKVIELSIDEVEAVLGCGMPDNNPPGFVGDVPVNNPPG